MNSPSNFILRTFDGRRFIFFLSDIKTRPSCSELNHLLLKRSEKIFTSSSKDFFLLQFWRIITISSSIGWTKPLIQVSGLFKSRFRPLFQHSNFLKWFFSMPCQRRFVSKLPNIHCAKQTSLEILERYFECSNVQISEEEGFAINF